MTPEEKGYRVVGGEVECPLWILGWDPADEEHPILVPCRSSLFLCWETSREVLAADVDYAPADGNYQTWTVSCAGGHVLVVGDVDGNGAPPFDVDRHLPPLLGRGWSCHTGFLPVADPELLEGKGATL